MGQVINKSSKFWDRIAKRYAKQPIADQQAYETKLALTRQYLTPQSQVLEFGCGTGSTAILHAPFAGHILAADSSKNMIEIAKAKVESGKIANVTFEQATLDDLEVEAEHFDMVLGLSILHLLDDMDAALARTYQLLKPGGVFISSTACVGLENVLLRSLLPILGMLGVIPKVSIFDAETLAASIRKAGFVIEHHTMPNKKGTTAFIIAKKP